REQSVDDGSQGGLDQIDGDEGDHRDRCSSETVDMPCQPPDAGDICGKSSRHHGCQSEKDRRPAPPANSPLDQPTCDPCTDNETDEETACRAEQHPKACAAHRKDGQPY